jgi:hypothetical protein
MERLEGYYWVKIKNYDDWIIALFTGNDEWYLCGEEDEIFESQFSEIGERITEPE